VYYYVFGEMLKLYSLTPQSCDCCIQTEHCTVAITR